MWLDCVRCVLPVTLQRCFADAVPACLMKGCTLHMQHRFPAAWAERAEEAQRKEARLRELLAAQKARQNREAFFLPVL